MKEVKKESKPKAENPMKGYNPTGRDFEFTEEDIDDVNKSELEEIERKKKTEQGNTRANKSKSS